MNVLLHTHTHTHMIRIRKEMFVHMCVCTRTRTSYIVYIQNITKLGFTLVLYVPTSEKRHINVPFLQTKIEKTDTQKNVFLKESISTKLTGCRVGSK